MGTDGTIESKAKLFSLSGSLCPSVANLFLLNRCASVPHRWQIILHRRIEVRADHFRELRSPWNIRERSVTPLCP
jgi:hypothetical protein